MTIHAGNSGNWVKQTIAALDNGVFSYDLGNAFPGSIRIIDLGLLNNSVVYYTITEGFNKECGVGVYTIGGSANGVLTRTTAFETLISGSYDRTSPARSTAFTTSAVIAISPTVQSLITHERVYKTVYNILPNPVLDYAADNLTETAFIGNIKIPTFDHTSSKSTSVMLCIGHDITGRTTPTPQPTLVHINIHLTPITAIASTMGIRWKFEYAVAAQGEEFVVAPVIELTTTISPGDENTNMIATFATEIPVTNPNSIIFGRLSRDPAHAGDTYNAGHVGLLAVSGTYLSDCLGTPQRTEPYNSWA